uniref:Uncharacterized protein n=1 Tax=Avena sativa TaxID=4498 RepID=A0ACD5URC6_AVESA
MYGNRPAGVLLLLAASAYLAVGASGGRSVISHAGVKGTRPSAPLHTDTASATLTRLLEDEVAPELSWAASDLGAGGNGYPPDSLNPSVCPSHATCAAKLGKPYTPSPRPCFKDLYRC